MDSPYRSLDKSFLWEHSVAEVFSEKIAPVARTDFKIRSGDKIATAGSCFAQHLSQNLTRMGFNYFVTERGSPFKTEVQRQAEGYG